MAGFNKLFLRRPDMDGRKRKGFRCLRDERGANKTRRSDFSSTPLEACTGKRRGHDSCVSDRRSEPGLNASATTGFVGRNGVFASSPVTLHRKGAS